MGAVTGRVVQVGEEHDVGVDRDGDVAVDIRGNVAAAEIVPLPTCSVTGTISGLPAAFTEVTITRPW